MRTFTIFYLIDTMIHTIFYVGILQYDAWIFFFLHTRIKLYISKLENGIDQKALATTHLCERKMYWFNFLQKQSPKMYSNDKTWAMVVSKWSIIGNKYGKNPITHSSTKAKIGIMNPVIWWGGFVVEEEQSITVMAFDL